MGGRHQKDGAIVRLVRKRPKEQQQREASDCLAAIERQIWAAAERVGRDPVSGPGLAKIAALAADAVNLGLYKANQADQGPGSKKYSMNEIARIFGTSRQAMQQRIDRGEAVFVRLEAKRSEGALVRIGDIREQRARALQKANLDDRTGSRLEIAASERLRAVGE